MDIKVEGADQLSVLSTRLKAAGNKDLAKSMRKRLTLGTKPVVADVRTAAQTMPSKHGNGELRKALARAVQSKITTAGKSTQVSVRVSGSRMPANQRGLPALVEGLRPWRHPVFKRKHQLVGITRWVGQSSHPFFYKTVTEKAGQVQDEVAKVLEDVARQIEG